MYAAYDGLRTQPSASARAGAGAGAGRNYGASALTPANYIRISPNTSRPDVALGFPAPRGRLITRIRISTFDQRALRSIHLGRICPAWQEGRITSELRLMTRHLACSGLARGGPLHCRGSMASMEDKLDAIQRAAYRLSGLVYLQVASGLHRRLRSQVSVRNEYAAPKFHRYADWLASWLAS